jgi:hypothetical protein
MKCTRPRCSSPACCHAAMLQLKMLDMLLVKVYLSTLGAERVARAPKVVVFLCRSIILAECCGEASTRVLRLD